MNKKIKILVLNGPNLNLLGTRESDIYGKKNLTQIVQQLVKIAKKYKIELEHFQSNSESSLINKVHQSKHIIHYILFNPAAFTHTSIALRDALLAVKIPFIEIHISNIYSRETFRSHSWFSDISNGIICGLGEEGYSWALKTAINRLINVDN
ncbi:3-dehydroquinate dehydratase [Buchnera aphidicola (Nipponaphis monzeni)]|uniref:3-dehydroquinate dehydratase n=1 Tax=Buchnera aphidicola (Nipponaphis monzeni) TaxID=2495405 RepID=A0A455TAD4_9GAMM|nr:type II 3-dehydroquinate dehydratase [Buchnera aphidicola]BBI01317.1 3-dehydroquinate dehydratase [Buchnera aphidicola (Nipponaphis monzeni)]